MNSRKVKNINDTIPNSSGEQLGSRNNAFNFIKTRFFPNNNNADGFQKSVDSNNRKNLQSSNSLAAYPQSSLVSDPVSQVAVKPTSRSFDELPVSKSPHQKIKGQRPMSMMAMESLLVHSSNLIPISRRNKSNTRPEKRVSLIVLREGYLFKKTDFRPFHKQSKLDRGWKLYKVILRGHKLYLFKVHGESPLRSLFPSSPSLSISSSIDNNSSTTSLKLASSEFDQEAQQAFFHNSINSAQGSLFMELDQIIMQPKRQVQLVMDSNYLYVCYRSNKKQLWKIEQKISIQQLKVIQLNSCVDSMDSPISPTSVNSQQSDLFLNSNLGNMVFNISFINKSLMLGVYSTQNLHAGQTWVQTFQSICQKKYIFIEEDLFSSKSNSSIDCRESIDPSVTSTATTAHDLEPGMDSKMYNVTQRYHHDLLREYRHDNSVYIIGGTMTALVHELLFTDSVDYLHIFLLNYSTFTTGLCVLNEIKALALDLSTKLDTRILNLFTFWCDNFALDVMGDVASGMISVLENINTVDTAKVKKLVLNTVNENAKFAGGDEIKNQHNIQRLNDQERMKAVEIETSLGNNYDSVDLTNLSIDGFSPALFLNISPCSFAEQVYLFHSSQHSKHRQALMNPLSYLPRPQTSTEMLNSLLFTTASPHFLTKLIRNHVLIDSQQQQQQDGVLLRAQLLKHWILVGIKLLELGDIGGWCAVSMGICSVGVVRLRDTWKLIERSLAETVQTQWARILTEHGLFEQSIWSETWERENRTNFAKVLDLNRADALPFFGTIRQAVDRQRRRPTKSLGPNIINFEECECIYRIIKQGLIEWKQQSNRSNFNKNIQLVEPLQLFFEHSVTDLVSVPHDLKYLQESSLACEPKIFGQVHNCHKLNNNEIMADLKPPSSSSLQFPAILESCTLSENGKNLIYPSKQMEFDNVDSKGASPYSHLHHSEGNILEAVYTNRFTDRKGFRRRTFNSSSDIDPTAANSDLRSSKNDVVESISSKSWFGSISSSRQNSIYSSEVIQKNFVSQTFNGEIDLSILQGELIFATSVILKGKKKHHLPMKRTESLHSVQFLKQEEYTEDDTNSFDQSELLVTVKGAHFDHLIECLISSVSFYHDLLKEQWENAFLNEELQHQVDRVVMDDENFINVFFIAYRSYYTSAQLLNALHRKYLDAKSKCKWTTKRKNTKLRLMETYFPSNILQGSSNDDIDQAEVDVNTYDWKKMSSIQLRILNLISFWVEEYPYDFIDEPEFIRQTNTFLNNAKDDLHSWCSLLKNYLQRHKEQNEDCQNVKQKGLTETLSIGSKIEKIISKLEYRFIHNSLSPCYHMKSIQFNTEFLSNAQDLYYRLMHNSQLFVATIWPTTNKQVPLSVSHEPLEQATKSFIDDYSPEYLLEQVDRNVIQLFECISIQDWAQTFDVLEAQCGDLYAWLPARKPSRTLKISTAFGTVIGAPSSHTSDYHVLPDEVVVSDIFTAIQGAKRSVVSPSAFSDDDLMLAFPGSIQYLCCMHFIIRSWAIHEISSSKIDLKTRVMRIEKFLKIVLLSKVCNERMALFPELIGSESIKKRVPGFVEYAIASALISPEVRLFSKAWNDIAAKYGQSDLDSLETLINKMQSTNSVTGSTSLTAPSSSYQVEKPVTVVPSLGWILERVVEICFSVPGTIDKKENMINFDKKRYLYHFLELVINVQADINEKEKQYTKDKCLNLSFFISPNPTKMNWEGLKEYASRENKRGIAQSTSSSINLLGSSSRSQGSKTAVFNKLIAKQIDKLKRDFKERDRVDKDLLALQHKLQKKQMEQAKSFEKQDKPYNVMPRINSFFKGLRPVSMVSSPIQHVFSLNNNEYPLTATKASTVINLIHSTTSIASTYIKRDFVFRIVTEEGGQYLFQAMDRPDMQGWMSQINDAAREGAVKRQSVLAAESLDNECERRKSAILTEASSRNKPTSHRKSVYGVSLDVLMQNRHIPLIVEKCIQEIEKRGLEEVGIYRVAGTGSIVTALKKEFNKEINKVDLSDQKWADINVIADAFKQFLRELPEPLLTYKYYDEFINASASEDHDQRVYLIKEVLKKLPSSNYVLLKRIIEHFVTVTDFEAINHMYATNLAIVFGPTLLQPAPGPASFVTTMSNLGHHQNTVKYLILNYHYLFDVESEEVEAKDEQSLIME